MPSSNRMSRQQRTKEKADAIFLAYYQMGPDRSLSKLFQCCTAMGLKTSEKTLKRYSALYQWQRYILEMENKLREKRENDAIEQVEKMNEQHAQLHQALLGLAAAGIRKFQRELATKKQKGQEQILDLNIYEITRLVTRGQQGERLARGQATSRSEVIVEVIGTFVYQFAQIFLAVNTIGDEQERKKEYLRRCDSMLHTVYPLAEKDELKLLGESK